VLADPREGEAPSEPRTALRAASGPHRDAGLGRSLALPDARGAPRNPDEPCPSSRPRFPHRRLVLLRWSPRCRCAALGMMKMAAGIAMLTVDAWSAPVSPGFGATALSVWPAVGAPQGRLLRPPVPSWGNGGGARR